MKLLTTGALALVMIGSALGAAAPAQASALQLTGGATIQTAAWHGHHRRQVCRIVWRHHHRVRVCNWRRW